MASKVVKSVYKRTRKKRKGRHSKQDKNTYRGQGR
jgi:hypothetical protein